MRLSAESLAKFKQDERFLIQRIDRITEDIMLLEEEEAPAEDIKSLYSILHENTMALNELRTFVFLRS